MKKITILLLSVFCFTKSFAQFEYPIKPHSAKDMNIKGKIKKVTEILDYTDRKGKIKNERDKKKAIYEFDESGNLVTLQIITYKYFESVDYYYTYIYSNGRLIQKNAKVKFSEPYTKYYTYAANKITEKNKDGEIGEMSTIEKGRVVETRSYTTSKTEYSFRHIYEYNNTGQLTKKTYRDDAASYNNYSTFETYEYNRRNDIEKKEQYNKEGKLDRITSYDYSYDKNQNWITCETQFFEPNEAKDDRLYSVYSRTYEYYANDENKVSNASLSGTVNIEMAIKNYHENSLYLAYNLGSKMYIVDTIKKVNGIFKYTGNDEIKDAIYKVALLPDNNYFHIIIDKNNRSFKLQTDASDLTKNMTFVGSEENRLLYENLIFIGTKRKEREQENGNMDKIKQEVSAFQNKLIKENPATYLSFYLNSNKDVELPAFSDIKNEADRKAAMYYYYKQNYFNNIDFSDARLLRTDYFEDKIVNYLDKLTVPSRDSVKVSVDFILKNAARDKEIYQFVASTLLNKYASSKIICMDAVYVHIAENYYCNSYAGKTADWVDAENLDKICKNAARLKPLLCGTKAPDIKLKLLPISNSTTAKISDIKAGYKVLIFWSLAGSQNDKMFTELDKIYPSFKNKNVEIISIATKSPEASSVEKYLFDYKAKWVNAIEIDNTAITAYNIKNPTEIFVLDNANTILYKQLAYDQIESVINGLTD